MVDKFDKATRSRIMASVRSQGNKSTELAMISILRKAHLTGWRRHQKMLGNPDFVWPQKKIALFVDGCFWHGCPTCKRTPKSNVDFWENKIRTNKSRDLRYTRYLRAHGWHVIRVWECKINKTVTVNRISRIYNAVSG